MPSARQGGYMDCPDSHSLLVVGCGNHPSQFLLGVLVNVRNREIALYGSVEETPTDGRFRKLTTQKT